MNSQSENSTQQNSAMDMLRKKNTRTLSELEQIPYQPQVYAIPIEQRKRESKLLADAVELAKAGNLNVIQAKEQLLSAEKTFSATKKWFTPNTYKFAQTNFAMVSAQETYQSAQNAAEVAVHKAYDTAVSTADNMDILVASIAYQEKNYEAMKQKYELGLIAKLDLDNSWYELQQNKMNLADYHYNCYLTVRQYQLSYTI